MQEYNTNERAGDIANHAQYFKDKSINLSSLVNKLLKEYIKNGN